MQYSVKELKENIQFCQNVKYQVDIAMKRLIQDDIEMLEQMLQTIKPDEELVRLSPSGEALYGYALLPVDERVHPNISLRDLIKPQSHELFWNSTFDNLFRIIGYGYHWSGGTANSPDKPQRWRNL